MGGNATHTGSPCHRLLAPSTAEMGEEGLRTKGSIRMTDTQGTPLPTENKIATQIDSAISGGEGLAEQAIDAAAETAEPVLKAPVLKQLFEAAVHWLLNIASKTGQILITFGITRAQATAENSDLVKAELAVEAAIQSGDANAIAQAEQFFQQAQSAAVNSDGSAKPQ